MTRRWRGYYDMGGIRIPPLPSGIVLTDREDGTLWLLSHNVTESSPDDLGYISITTTIPSNMTTRTFDAFDEPFVGTDPRLRLLVRDGYLGFEIEDLPQGITDRDTARNLTRRAFAAETREIIKPSTWQETSPVLGWEDVEF